LKNKYLTGRFWKNILFLFWVILFSGIFFANPHTVGRVFFMGGMVGNAFVTFTKARAIFLYATANFHSVF